jgi:DNA-binding GntR family transcriptional regulator
MGWIRRTPDMTKKLNRYVLSEEIYSIIKQKIMNQEFAPGDKINIDQLARDLGVSNIPIREVLGRLLSEGLVTTIPFKGMFVTHLSVTELKEIFEIRQELEAYAISKAIQRIPKDKLYKLTLILSPPTEGSTAPAEAKDGLNTIIEINENLHGLILSHAGNDTLCHLVRDYIQKIQRYLSLMNQPIEQSLVEAERTEHLKIVHALLADDEEKAVQSMKEHLQSSYRRTRLLIPTIETDGGTD